MRLKLLSLKQLAPAGFALIAASLLSSCATSPRISSRTLPAYEPPLARSHFQTVRTTAYTHSEADHIRYGARNALGGVLQSASAPSGPSRSIPRALPLNAALTGESLNFGYMTRKDRIAVTRKYKAQKKGKASASKSRKTKGRKSSKPEPPRIGSAAADWSRWPAGTLFRVVSTGQMYRVDDYGWALAGRNTIDLYMSTQRDMNRWGVRNEGIEVLQWGDPQYSLGILRGRMAHKHVRRMVLSLEGQHESAAALR